MWDHIVPMLMGIVVIVIGIVNMTGNVRSLHKYHRSRVAPEDIKPFGRLIGIGTILNGAGITLFGLFGFIGMMASSSLLSLVGTVLLIVGVVLGLIVLLFAMFKYNKGIF